MGMRRQHQLTTGGSQERLAVTCRYGKSPLDIETQRCRSLKHQNRTPCQPKENTPFSHFSPLTPTLRQRSGQSKKYFDHFLQ